MLILSRADLRRHPTDTVGWSRETGDKSPEESNIFEEAGRISVRTKTKRMKSISRRGNNRIHKKTHSGERHDVIKAWHTNW